MAIEIKVPQLPESVADATLVTWHKQVGQAVSRDENLADLETDKVVLEVPAPVNGVLKELKIVAGTSVTSGQVLAVLEEGGAGAAATKAAPAPAPAAAKPTAAAAPRIFSASLMCCSISATSNASLLGKYSYSEPIDTPARSAMRFVVPAAYPEALKT